MNVYSTDVRGAVYETSSKTGKDIGESGGRFIKYTQISEIAWNKKNQAHNSWQ